MRLVGRTCSTKWLQHPDDTLDTSPETFLLTTLNGLAVDNMVPTVKL
jgi:hypothetical protein